MGLSVKQMIELNNKKRQLLTSENESYYSNLLVYIRSIGFKNEKAMEEKLLEILDKLIKGQNEGDSAEDLFGISAKDLGNEILQSIPEASFKEKMEFGLEIGLTLFGWFLVIWGIVPLIKNENPIVYLGSFVVSLVLLVVSLSFMIILIMGVLKKNAFENKRNSNKIIIASGGIVGLLFVASILVQLVVPPFGIAFEVTYFTPIGLGSFFLLASYLLKKSRESK
ncbi:hypothetical protein MTP04_14910 [Lysinibacillus sp. PLM2]|nr:hypothetical protein MTP04_14910 [Lysinibacillus sp. PLM2]